MGNLQKTNLGVAPDGAGGDDSRTGFARNNANVDVLNSQAALTTYPTQITANQDLPAACVGKRVNINNVDSVGLPAARDAGVDGFLVLRNVGTRSTGVWPGGGNPTAPQSAFMTLHPGESVALDTDGVSPWRVLFRGRAGGANETIDGTLTVSGGIAGDLSATGKLNGLNGANLLLNGSAEFGSLGWGGPLVAAQDTNGAAGTFFICTAALTSALVHVSPQISVGGGIPLVLSGEIQTNGVSAGTAYMQMQFFDKNGKSLGYSGGANVPNGVQWTPTATASKTPDGTFYAIVLLMLQGATVNAVSYGIAFRRIKVEYGNTSSLYSQETSIAYLQSALAVLQGAPALTGRPTFGGKIPWDNGNLPNPVQNTALNTYTQPQTYSGLGTTYNTCPILIANPSTGYPTIALANNTNGGVIRYNSTGNYFETLNSVASAYIGITVLSVIQTSDKDLKTDIEVLPSVMERLRTKRIVSYRMKAAAIDAESDRVHYGAIAQEWRDDFPELVIETSTEIDADGDFIAHQYDDRGVEIFGPSGKPKARKALGFDYSGAAAVALAGLIETDATIAAMKRRMDELETKLAEVLAKAAR